MILLPQLLEYWDCRSALPPSAPTWFLFCLLFTRGRRWKRRPWNQRRERQKTESVSPWLGQGRWGGCRAVASRPGRGPSPQQQPPCVFASGGLQERPLEGAGHCWELLAPLWSQSREVSWAKRRPEAASCNHEFTDTSSCQSGLKPWPWKQPAALRDLSLRTPEPSPHLERSHSGDK